MIKTLIINDDYVVNAEKIKYFTFNSAAEMGEIHMDDGSTLTFTCVSEKQFFFRLAEFGVVDMNYVNQRFPYLMSTRDFIAKYSQTA